MPVQSTGAAQVISVTRRPSARWTTTSLAMLGMPSPYLTVAFPNRPPQDTEYLDFEGVSPRGLARWKRDFLRFLKTITYTLNAPKPDYVKSHVGHMVQVTGVEAAPQVTAASTDKSAGAANTQGTTGSVGGAKPNIETTAQTQIVVRQLTVSSVKMVSPNCSLVK